MKRSLFSHRGPDQYPSQSDDHNRCCGRDRLYHGLLWGVPAAVPEFAQAYHVPLQDDIKVVVYVTDAVSAQALADLQARIKSDREVAGRGLCLQESRPWPTFASNFHPKVICCRGSGKTLFRRSLLVTMAHPSRSSEAVKRWADRLQRQCRAWPRISTIGTGSKAWAGLSVH